MALPERADAAGKIGAHLGYAKTRDADDGNGLVGGHLELRLAPFLGVEGAVDYRSDVVYKLDPGELEVRSIPVTVSGHLYVPGPVVSPYAVAGAGWYHLVYDYSPALESLGLEDDTEQTFGWHVGAGVDMALSPQVSIFGEGRAVFVDPERDLDQDVLDDVSEFDYDSTYFAGGLSLAF